MTPAGQKVCLNMIVKNEAPVIRRCIESVRPLIDSWVIVDTGSTDGTQKIIRKALRDLPGELHERPWRDFAHNRSEALELARPFGDYTLIIDADDTLDFPAGATFPMLTEDSYSIDIADTNLSYSRIQLVRSALPWRYEGVLHEFLTCTQAQGSGHLPKIRMLRNHDGARRRDTSTYRKDASILEAALETETDPFLIARYRFYLAQSYRDAGDSEKALANYLIRAGLGFWHEEIFISLYGAAQLKEQLEYPEEEVIATFLQATDAMPSRAEALHGASRFCRLKGRYEEGYRLAKRGLGIPMPRDGLFIEPWIYENGVMDELAVNAYWSGHNRDSLDACLRILSDGRHNDPARICANARFAFDKLYPSSGLPGEKAPGEPAPLHATLLTAHDGSDWSAGARDVHSRLPEPAPRVLAAILVQQEEAALDLYLECLENLDYPKSSIVLYVRTAGNQGRTAGILKDWLEKARHLYAAVDFDDAGVAEGAHRSGAAANESLAKAAAHGCDFYFVAGQDNFLRPFVLRELVSLNLPIAAPLLRHIERDNPYSNFHAGIDGNGYYADAESYWPILHRNITGVFEVPVVLGTYLVRADVIASLGYADGSSRHEYVVFSDRARKMGIPQYIDNRQVYGYLTPGDDGKNAREHAIHVRRLIAG
jgi:glycosyltransferase involved in cell wall biosynthesis